MKFQEWLILEDRQPPKIVGRRDEYDSPPHIDIWFPSNNSVWRYVIPDQFYMNYFLRYRRNVGRLVSKLKADPKVQQIKLR